MFGIPFLMTLIYWESSFLGGLNTLWIATETLYRREGFFRRINDLVQNKKVIYPISQ